LKTQSHKPTVYLHHGNKKNIDHSWTYLFSGYDDRGHHQGTLMMTEAGILGKCFSDIKLYYAEQFCFCTRSENSVLEWQSIHNNEHEQWLCTFGHFSVWNV